MATDKSIEIIDFHAQDAEKLVIQFFEEDTIGDLKLKIVEKEGYDSIEEVTLFWQFFELENDFLVKEYSDKSGEIFVSFADYADVTSDGETIVFLGRRKWVKLFPGRNETIKIPKSGKFAVMRNKVDGEEKLFEARVYKVRDYWKIDIRVDKENQDAQVFHVHDDGKEERLIAKDVRQYSLEKKGSRFNIKNITAGVRTVTSIASLVFDILDFFSV